MVSVGSKKSGHQQGDIRYSIIITCYNQQGFIRDAVESVLAQPCFAKELIVVDDGSDDSSVSVLRQYESSLRLIALSKNEGVNEARNRGAAAAKGEYLIFLDGDDLFTPWALDTYDQLIAQRSPVAILSQARWFEDAVPVIEHDEEPKKIEFVEYESLMAKDRVSGMYIGAFVIERAAFNRVGGWTPGVWHLDGQDLYAKLAYSGKAILVLSPYTMLYRMHGGNSILAVESYVGAAQSFIDRERSGHYPGGRVKKFERYARHGGVIFFCVKRLWRAGFHAGAVRVALRGWNMIIVAVMRKSTTCVHKRRSIETCELRLNPGHVKESFMNGVEPSPRDLVLSHAEVINSFIASKQG